MRFKSRIMKVDDSFYKKVNKKQIELSNKEMREVSKIEITRQLAEKKIKI